MSDIWQLDPYQQLNEEIPENFFSYTDIKSKESFDTTYKFHQQIDEYQEKYSVYDAAMLSKYYINEIATQLTPEDIINPPKAVRSYNVRPDIGGIIFIILASGKSVLLAMINGNFRIRFYENEEAAPAGFYIVEDPERNIQITSNKRTYRLGQKTVKENYRKLMTDLNLTVSRHGETTYPVEPLPIGQKTFIEIFRDAMQLLIKRLAEGLRTSLNQDSTAQQLAKIFIPFYDVIYRAVTETNFKLSSADIFSIFVDVVDVLTLFASAGVKITSLIAEETASAAAKNFSYSLLKTHRILNIINTVNTVINLPQFLQNFNELSAISLLGPFLASRRLSDRLIKPNQLALLSVNNHARRYGSLKKEWAINKDNFNPSEWKKVSQGVYQGTWHHSSSEFNSQNAGKYFIEEDGNYYQVIYDDYSRTLRVSPPNATGFTYKTPVKLSPWGDWVTHSTVPGLGGGNIHPHASIGNTSVGILSLRAIRHRELARSAPEKLTIISATPDYLQQAVNTLVSEINLNREIKSYTTPADQRISNARLFKGADELNREDVQIPIGANRTASSRELVEQFNTCMDLALLQAQKAKTTFNDEAMRDYLNTYVAEALQLSDPRQILQAKNWLERCNDKIFRRLQWYRERNYKDIYFFCRQDTTLEPENPIAKSMLAYVVPGDLKKRIFINTETFFTPKIPRMIGDLDMVQQVKVDTLFHELTHHLVGSSDFAYLPDVTNAHNARNRFLGQLTLYNRAGNPDVNNIDPITKEKFIRTVYNLNPLQRINDSDVNRFFLEATQAVQLHHSDDKYRIAAASAMLQNPDNLAIYLRDIANRFTADQNLSAQPALSGFSRRRN